MAEKFLVIFSPIHEKRREEKRREDKRRRRMIVVVVKIASTIVLRRKRRQDTRMIGLGIWERRKIVNDFGHEAEGFMSLSSTSTFCQLS